MKSWQTLSCFSEMGLIRKRKWKDPEVWHTAIPLEGDGFYNRSE